MVDYMVEKRDNYQITKFFINTEERTVVCVMTVYDEVARRLRKYGLDAYDFMGEFRTYKGVAKCAEGDVWDEDFGMHLAEYKAMIARRADVNKDLKEFICSTSKKMDNLYDYGLMKKPIYPTKGKED